MNPLSEQPYQVNQQEQELLQKEITRYFKHPKRSTERKDICAQTAQELRSLNTAREWTDKDVRIWFRNNRDRFLDKNETNAGAPLSRSSMSVDSSVAAPRDSLPDRITVRAHPNVELHPDDPVSFPEVPTAEQVDRNGSEQLCVVLRKYARAVFAVAKYPLQLRNQMQPKIEQRFVEALGRFMTQLRIEVPHHVDVSTTIVASSEKVVEGSSFKFLVNRVPTTVKLPNVRALYSGQMPPDGYHANTLSSVLCVLLGVGEDLLQLYYDSAQRSYNIGLGHMRVSTGYWLPPTAVTAGEKHFWVAGDNRVKAFGREDLSIAVTLCVREEPVRKSSIALLGQVLVLAVGTMIYCWEEPMKRRLPETKFNPATVLEQEGVTEVDDGTVDAVLGREPSRVMTVQLGEGGGVPIDAICAIGGSWLAVASEHYPVIHIFDKTLNLTTRLIGHTMGITCLCDFGNRLFSGSRDRTIKLWEVKNGQLHFAYHGHTKKVTCLCLSLGRENEVFLFSGAGDKSVRAWDVMRKKAVFEMVVDSEVAPKALDFCPETNELSVLTSAPDRTEAELRVYRFG
jgi:hypothetical protein